MREKILLLITNLGQGGAQRVFHDHSVFLNESYHVDEAVFNLDESDNLFQSGNKLFSLDVNAGKGFVGKALNFFRRCLRLKKIIEGEEYSVCISHMDGANWVNVLSLSKAKKILVVHGTILHDHNQSKWMQFIRKNLIIPFVYNKANVTVTVSEGIKYELQQFCKVKNAVAIPNYFDVEKIRSLAKKPLEPHWENLFSTHEILITSGRFNEQKKQRFLFPLLKRLKEINPRVRLVLLGDGKLRGNLMQIAKENGLSYYSVWDDMQPFSEDYDVYFTGYTTNPFQYLRRSKLFLFPSGWEGFPMALCEAMISGVPVLTADCPTGPRQILAPHSFDPTYSLKKAEQTDYGWLMPMTDKASFEDEWHNAIVKMLHHEKLSENIRENAAARMMMYSKEKVVGQWKELIDSLL
ncbi:MAG TPA: glycosyltransferase [Flavipsychrobacter sp.]|nr:glycosyltransferase [Flavipsychrobacter sp.]